MLEIFPDEHTRTGIVSFQQFYHHYKRLPGFVPNLPTKSKLLVTDSI